jgi:hypothetical protein
VLRGGHWPDIADNLNRRRSADHQFVGPTLAARVTLLPSNGWERHLAVGWPC